MEIRKLRNEAWHLVNVIGKMCPDVSIWLADDSVNRMLAIELHQSLLFKIMLEEEP